MRPTVLQLIIVLVLASTASKSLAQWVQTNISSGEVANCLAANSSQVFVGTEEGVFRSIDGGLTWSQTSGGLPDTTVYAIAINGSYVLAGTGSGVFLSTN